MKPTLPPPAPGDEPGTVHVTLAGHPADLFKVAFWLGQVTDGQDPAEALRAVGLSAISATTWTGRGYRAAITLTLTGPAAGTAAPGSAPGTPIPLPPTRPHP